MPTGVEILFRNWYHHCGITWTSDWDSMCNDECPHCQISDIEPYFSIEIEQTEEVWEEKYKPIQFGADDDCFNGRLIEPTDDLSRVKDPASQDHVWTLLECDGKQIIVPGYHLVNRMGYFITENAWIDVEGDTLEYYVHVDPPEDEDENAT